RVVAVQRAVETLKWPEVRSSWFLFLHTTDMDAPRRESSGFIKASRGAGLLNEHVADYVFLYGDGSEGRVEIRRRHQLGMISRGWGENCFEAVSQQKPHPVQTTSETGQGTGWGDSQTRVEQPDWAEWINWLWAWRNPHPDKDITGLRIEPKAGALILSAISA